MRASESPLWPNIRKCARAGWKFSEHNRVETYRIAVAEMLGMFWFVNLSGAFAHSAGAFAHSAGAFAHGAGCRENIHHEPEVSS